MGDLILPEDLVSRAARIVELFKQRNLTLALAESCTGGLIAACITAISGSSSVLDRGYVTYSNASKHEAIGVPTSLIEQHGAVSEEVAAAMADGVRRSSDVNVGLSVTGIAGPTGGSAEKPVGLVYIAKSTEGHMDVRRFKFDGGRDEVRRQAVIKALSMLVAEGNEAL